MLIITCPSLSLTAGGDEGGVIREGRRRRNMGKAKRGMEQELGLEMKVK